MTEKTGFGQIDRFVMNNCKIANELRKYRDLSGCLNQVTLSGTRVRRPSDAADYAEYFISEDLSYMDLVVANAAYTLMWFNEFYDFDKAIFLGRVTRGKGGDTLISTARELLKKEGGAVTIELPDEMSRRLGQSFTATQL